MALFFLLSVSTFGQVEPLIYTSKFTRLLKKAELEFFKPVEVWLRIKPVQRDRHMRYDLILHNEVNDFEVRYRILPSGRSKMETYPHIEASRLAASLASNADNSEIRVQVPDPAFVRETYNADWCTVHSFVPKASNTEKSFGSLLSILAEDQAMVNIVLLYDDPEYNVLEQFRQVRFQE